MQTYQLSFNVKYVPIDRFIDRRHFENQDWDHGLSGVDVGVLEVVDFSQFVVERVLNVRRGGVDHAAGVVGWSILGACDRCRKESKLASCLGFGEHGV